MNPLEEAVALLESSINAARLVSARAHQSADPNTAREMNRVTSVLSESHRFLSKSETRDV